MLLHSRIGHERQNLWFLSKKFEIVDPDITLSKKKKKKNKKEVKAKAKNLDNFKYSKIYQNKKILPQKNYSRHKISFGIIDNRHKHYRNTLNSLTCKSRKKRIRRYFYDKQYNSKTYV